MREILIYDFETTSLSEKKGCIVEVGATALDLDTGKTKVVFDSLLKEDHFDEKQWEYTIVKERYNLEPKPYIKGWIFGNSDLTPKQILEAPGASGVLAEFQLLIKKYPLGIAAFNRGFDNRYAESRGINLGVKLPCLMKCLRDTIRAVDKNGNRKNPNAQEAYNYFFPNKPRTELHRGADDSQMEALIAFEAYKIGVFKVD